MASLQAWLCSSRWQYNDRLYIRGGLRAAGRLLQAAPSTQSSGLLLLNWQIQLILLKRAAKNSEKSADLIYQTRTEWIKGIDCNSGGTQAEASQPRVINALLHMFPFRVVSLALLALRCFCSVNEICTTSLGLLLKFGPFGKQQINVKPYVIMVFSDQILSPPPHFLFDILQWIKDRDHIKRF